MINWDAVQCSLCGGHGLTPGWGGIPDECRDCGGGGFLYRHRKHGTLALYPGGPFKGSDKAFDMKVI